MLDFMTIFGQSRLTRITYAVLLLLMFCFDIAKDPIERLIMAEHDQASRELMAPRSTGGTGTAVGGEVSGKNMPLMFKGQEELVKQIAASGRRPTAEDLQNLRAMAAKGATQMRLRVGASDAETAKLVSRRSFFETLYMVVGIAMTAITIVGLLYMVSSRLRDIGWPQYLLWLLLAPVFLPRFFAIPLPTLAIQGITFFFYGALLVLAFIPGEDSSPPARYKLAQPTPAKRRPGQFGRLGTQ
ncbi:hypothetical protein HJA87_13935 [Rhizobium bangladeshense]|uniref:DUF1189 domain-containing protein n=1 Tax=Rhizobium bangladeshense TaxID=1138189 RepID=A0ABS7LHN8_9HYPH|nr:hypothetical protein [Rhizobium bangladeshense]MBX4872519.1 hypothetical protein [Rhizobium bangladeshense]MBX4887706.1 hypothetical protein [Rhizobium bangladeshense]MBY3590969.1 hypothetical protein [Rhizobium bangladeshense]